MERKWKKKKKVVLHVAKPADKGNCRLNVLSYLSFSNCSTWAASAMFTPQQKQQTHSGAFLYNNWCCLNLWRFSCGSTGFKSSLALSENAWEKKGWWQWRLGFCIWTDKLGGDQKKRTGWHCIQWLPAVLHNTVDWQTRLTYAVGLFKSIKNSNDKFKILDSHLLLCMCYRLNSHSSLFSDIQKARGWTKHSSLLYCVSRT